MCGYFAFIPRGKIGEFAATFNIVEFPKNVEFDQLKSLKYYPKSRIPTISKNSPNQLVLRYWSLIPRWWIKDPYRLDFSTFNARSEGIEEKAVYRSAWKEGNRCLIPADWFYEFKSVGEGKEKKKVPYSVELESGKIMALAGLYETWKDVEGFPIESCTIITTQAIKPLSEIHNRQPVIIEENDWERWLDKGTMLNEIKGMLKGNEKLEIKEIDHEFNKSSPSDITLKMLGK